MILSGCLFSSGPRRYRSVVAAAFLLALAGCAAGPVGDAPPQLSKDEFANWVSQVNSVARKAVVDKQNASTLDQVRHTFNAVADSVDKSPGEASWIISQWRERSGNLGTLFDYFLKRDYLLNYYFFDRGSDLLVPLEHELYGLTVALDSLQAMFGSDEGFVSPRIVDAPKFVFGTSYGATPIVNRAKAQELHVWIREHMEKTSTRFNAVGFGVVMQVIAANEVAHATLAQRYGFTVESPFELAPIQQQLPGLKIETARQAHEFISDAASLGTDRISIFALTANLLQLSSSTSTGEIELSNDSAYSPGAKFFMQSVQQILNRRGRELDLKELIGDQIAKDRTLRRYASGQLSIQILEALGDEGYRDLVNDYRRYAQILIHHIKTAKAS